MLSDSRLRLAMNSSSGSRGTLPFPSPLRTGRADCSASGSSLCRFVSHPLVMPVMAPPVQEAQVPRFVPAALVARLGVVLVQGLPAFAAASMSSTDDW